MLGPPYPLRGTSSDPNNNSLVLRGQVRRRYGSCCAGDAETEEQQALLARHPAAVCGPTC